MSCCIMVFIRFLVAPFESCYLRDPARYRKPAALLNGLVNETDLQSPEDTKNKHYTRSLKKSIEFEDLIMF